MLYDKPEAASIPGRDQRAGNQNVLWRSQCRGVGKILNMSKSNVMNWIKKAIQEEKVEEKIVEVEEVETAEMDELYWFMKRKPRTKTRENIYIMTLVNRNPRQILGHSVSHDKSAPTLQSVVDSSSIAQQYCTDGYVGYLEVVFPGEHIFNVHNKNDTFTVEGVNADLRHYIPILARCSRCFLRKLENLQAVLAVFVRAYNLFGVQKACYRSLHPTTEPPFSLFYFF